MKKTYETPDLEIIELDPQNTITASGAVDEDEDDW